MLLREYLYVDKDKVHGLAGQLYDGVPEKATNVTARQKKLGGGPSFIKAESVKSDDESTEKSLSDSLFKDLEADLEALQLLRDMSADFKEAETWGNIRSLVKPGDILRISAPGALFHPRQISEVIIGMATAAHGLGQVGGFGASPVVPPRAKTGGQKKNDRGSRKGDSLDTLHPEDHLPEGDVIPLMNVQRSLMQGMIKTIRGVFGEGVHLLLRPCGMDGPIVSARLEEGRRFLDSSPEVLLSRYGLEPQELTVVGIVGQLAKKGEKNKIIDVRNPDGSANRAKLVDAASQFFKSTAGLVDLPQGEGFSLVPLAVYRAIGEPISPEGPEVGQFSEESWKGCLLISNRVFRGATITTNEGGVLVVVLATDEGGPARRVMLRVPLEAGGYTVAPDSPDVLGGQVLITHWPHLSNENQQFRSV